LNGLTQDACAARAAILSAAALLALTACLSTKALAPPFEAIATIQDIMTAEVDPSADHLWASVSTVSTAAGTEENQPRTPAEWKAVRSDAITLIEATNLLLLPNRHVAAPGTRTEDANIPGIESPQSIRAAIDSDPARFIAAALLLRAASVQALQAIDRKDPAALTEAGGEIDAACEACHLIYWYPHSPRPP
jgi:hypothetical protein